MFYSIDSLLYLAIKPVWCVNISEQNMRQFVSVSGKRKVSKQAVEVVNINNSLTKKELLTNQLRGLVRMSPFLDKETNEQKDHLEPLL